ncbi:MAG: CrcB family protein [Chloroflexi bacterium]|nr:CrcB family protein [Chloroflexota bacterium]
MTDLLLVGMGGFIGAASRYGVILGVSRVLGQPSFPWGVLAVNVLGSLLIGVLAGLVETRQLFGPGARLFLFVGVLGGFTTFSAITNDTLTLLRSAAYLSAAANVLLTVALGLAAVAIGYAAARAM